MVTHRNVVRLMKNERFPFDFGPEDVWMVAHSFCFDFSVWEMYGALLYGGRVIVARPEAVQDTLAFHDFIRQAGVSVLNQTPAAFYNLIDIECAQDRHDLGNHLRYVIFGGDRLEPAYLQPWIDRYPLEKIKLINMYGITETTVHVTYGPIEPADVLAPEGRSPIGVPLPETRVYVCDERMNLQPIGVPGEMYVGGTGVCRGYLNRPGLTDQRFIDDPFQSGEKLYRTGDIGRWRADGTLEHLGRNDAQVQVRGFRVEPGEIESRLIQHPSVDQAVVLARPTRSGFHELIAYLAGRQELNTAELRAHIGARLPEYMVPSYFVWVNEFPLTSNKKVDRKALPDPSEVGIERETAYVAPANETHRRLVQIWREVLGVDKIGIRDNFFELGGHSLKAMQVMSRIHKAIGVKISLRDFFSQPTIAALARRRPKGRDTAFFKIEPAPIQKYYDLSYAQQRLWIVHRLGGQSAYNMPQTYLFEGPMDVAALKKSFATLADRHEALRTAFIEVAGEPKQRIHEHVDLAVQEIDLRGGDAPETRAREIAEQDALTPFDLGKPPLLRVTVMTVGEKRYVFLLTMHHIIGDGWSMNVLGRELSILYEAYCRNRPNPLKPLPIQYKDFAVWQNAQGFEREEKYWLSKLAGVAERLNLPYDFRPQEGRGVRGKTETLGLDPESIQNLRKFAGRNHTTLSNVMLTIFKLFLFRLTLQDDICVGMAIANRNHPDTESLIGFFVNILPVRTRFSETMEFEELLEQVIQNTIEAQEYQDYPFDLLIKKMNPQRYGNRQPFLNVIYTFQNFSDVSVGIDARPDDLAQEKEKDRPTVHLAPFDISFDTSKFDLTLSVCDYGRDLQLHLEYDTGLFAAETIQKYLAILERFARMAASQIIVEEEQLQKI